MEHLTKAQFLFFAATNDHCDQDEALLCRFQKRFNIPLPDIDERLAILKMSLRDHVDESFGFLKASQRSLKATAVHISLTPAEVSLKQCSINSYQ